MRARRASRRLRLRVTRARTAKEQQPARAHHGKLVRGDLAGWRGREPIMAMDLHGNRSRDSLTSRWIT